MFLEGDVVCLFVDFEIGDLYVCDVVDDFDDVWFVVDVFDCDEVVVVV